MPLALSSYSVVLAVHIAAVVAAFGLPLAYPLLLPYVRSRYPEAMAGVHDVQHRLNQRLTAPLTVVILLAGAYMASKGHYWGKVWVDVPFAILVIIGGVGGAIVTPSTKRMSELARADLEATPAGSAVTLGDAYERVYRRYMKAEVTLAALVLVAIFFMAAKP